MTLAGCEIGWPCHELVVSRVNQGGEPSTSRPQRQVSHAELLLYLQILCTLSLGNKYNSWFVVFMLGLNTCIHTQ